MNDFFLNVPFVRYAYSIGFTKEEAIQMCRDRWTVKQLDDYVKRYTLKGIQRGLKLGLNLRDFQSGYTWSKRLLDEQLSKDLKAWIIYSTEEAIGLPKNTWNSMENLYSVAKKDGFSFWEDRTREIVDLKKKLCEKEGKAFDIQSVPLLLYCLTDDYHDLLDYIRILKNKLK